LTKLTVNGAGPWFGTALKPATGAGIVGGMLVGDGGTGVLVGLGLEVVVGGTGVNVATDAGLTTTTTCALLCPPGPSAISVTV